MSDAVHQNMRISDMAWYSCRGRREKNNIVDEENYSLADNKAEDCGKSTDNLVIAADGKSARVEFKHLNRASFEGYIGVRAMKTTYRDTELQKYFKFHESGNDILNRHYLFRTVGALKQIKQIVVTKTTKILDWVTANLTEDEIKALHNPSKESEEIIKDCKHIIKAYPDAYFLRVPIEQIDYKVLN